MKINVSGPKNFLYEDENSLEWGISSEKFVSIKKQEFKMPKQSTSNGQNLYKTSIYM